MPVVNKFDAPALPKQSLPRREMYIRKLATPSALSPIYGNLDITGVINFDCIQLTRIRNYIWTSYTGRPWEAARQDGAATCNRQ